MKTIYKYEISLIAVSLLGHDHLMLPAGGIVLSVQIQGDNLCLWAEVDVDQPLVSRYFTVVGTGNAVPKENPIYWATVQKDDVVWHVYELS
jgi:hypothetical protein